MTKAPAKLPAPHPFHWKGEGGVQYSGENNSSPTHHLRVPRSGRVLPDESVCRRPATQEERNRPSLHLGGFEEAVEGPRNVLDNDTGRVCQRHLQVYLHHVSGMRRHREPVGEREISDLPPLGDPTQSRHIRLCILHCVRAEESRECIQRIKLLSEGDRCRMDCASRLWPSTSSYHIGSSNQPT